MNSILFRNSNSSIRSVYSRYSHFYRNAANYTILKDDSEFVSKVSKSEKNNLLYFSASWCPPCRITGPHFEKLSDEFGGDGSNNVFYKIDVDENPQTASRFQVMSIPTTISFKNGSMTKEPVIGADLPKIKSLIE